MVTSSTMLQLRFVFNVVSASTLIVLACLLRQIESGIYLQGTSSSYIRFPRWRTCQNASLSFDFRPLRPEALLLYADDGGRSSFVALSYNEQGVSVRINMADGRGDDPAPVSITVNRPVTDTQWHTVELRRNRMETILTVDGASSRRHFVGMPSTGSSSGGQFGDSPGDSYVFFGGMPAEYQLYERMVSLTLPSVVYESRFKGFVRNVLYGNCSCLRVRVGPLDGNGFEPLLGSGKCDRRHNCSRGCICLTTDDGYKCDCSEQSCLAGLVARYWIPMNAVDGNIVVNPSELEVTVGPNAGNAVQLVNGVENSAVQFDGSSSFIDVSARGFEFDCIGDFNKCTAGFSLSFWLNIKSRCHSTFSILYVGSHVPGGTSGILLLGHGQTGLVEFIFWQKSGRVWRVNSTEVVTGRWNHVTVTWSPLAEVHTIMYVDGRISSTGALYGGSIVEKQIKELKQKLLAPVAGKTSCLVAVDDVYFQSKTSNEMEAKELGAFVCSSIITDLVDENNIYIGYNLLMEGSVNQVPGKIGIGLLFDSFDDVLVSSDLTSTCLGNLVRCGHGLTLSFWIKFEQTSKAVCFFDTGINGLTMCYSDRSVVVSAAVDARKWTVLWSAMLLDRWYFVEITWSATCGLAVLVDRKLVANTSDYEHRKNSASFTDKKFYIGRRRQTTDQVDVESTNYKFVLDEMKVCYGNRDELIKHGILHPDRPPHYVISMDTIVDDVMQHSTLVIHVHGRPVTVPGRINNATRLDGEGQYIDVGDQSNTCLGSLINCINSGLTLTIWVKFRRLEPGMYYLSTGNGIKVFYGNDSQLKFEAVLGEKRWLVAVAQMQVDTWYFVEMTWTLNSGLRVYIDQKLRGQQSKYQTIRSSTTDNKGNHFLIGYANDTDETKLFGDFLVDEIQFWFVDRDTLLAFQYVARDNTTHYIVHMNKLTGNMIEDDYDDLVVRVTNGTQLVQGDKNKWVLRLQGSEQYATVVSGVTNCLTNLDMCQCGFMTAFFVRVNGLFWKILLIAVDSQYYLQLSDDGSLEISVSASGEQLRAATGPGCIEMDRWHRIELSWHQDKGIQLYIDKKIVQLSSVDRQRSPVSFPFLNTRHNAVFVGKVLRPTENEATSSSSPSETEVLIDELEFWFADRDQLKAFGWLGDDVNVVILDMEQLNNDLLVHPTHVIYIHGSPQIVRSKHGNGLLLNGLNQYVDVGKDISCKDNLDNCPKGFTLRFTIKPFQLSDRTYFVSSASVDVYYRDSHLIAEVRTLKKQWRVTSSELELGAWQKIEVSWHSVDGAELFINGNLVATDVQPATNEIDYNSTWRVYIGRANTDMRHENFANAIFDNVEFWETRRDGIDLLGLNNGESVKPSGQARPVKGRSSGTAPADQGRHNHPRLTTAMPTSSHIIRQYPSSTLGYYVQIPTGKPVYDPQSNLPAVLPTLMPRARKKLTFDGRAWIRYDISKLPVEYQRRRSSMEQLHIKLQTQRPNGLLWFSGTDERNMHLSMKNGILQLVVKYDEETKSDKFKIEPENRLDDNQWHNIYVTRRNKQVTITVDSIGFPRTLMNATSLLVPSFGDMMVAGSENTWKLTDKNMRNNFHGTIDKVVVSADGLPGDINLFDLTLLKPTPEFVDIRGNVNSVSVDDLPETAGETAAITFTRPESYLRLSRWNIDRAMASIELTFKSVEPHGLLTYCGGRHGQKDFIAIELFDGVPYTVLNFGDRVHRFRFSKQPKAFNDGMPHFIKVEIVRKQIKLIIDNEERFETVVSVDDTLDTGTFLYIGAVDNPARLSWHLWTSNPKYFVGCVWGVRVNGGDVQDLPQLIIEQQVTGVERGCRTKGLACVHPQCANNGTCVDRWDSFQCICDGTAFTGDKCDKDAAIMLYTGNQQTIVNLRPPLTTHTDQASIRFKTPVEFGLLFTVSSRAINNYIKASLDNGRIAIEVKMGGTMRAPFQLTLHCQQDQLLSDDKWHTLNIRRRANYLEGWIDYCQHSTVEIPGDGYHFDIDRITIANPGSDNYLNQNLYRTDSTTTVFTGHLQNFIFNHLNVFELVQRQTFDESSGVSSVINTGELTSVVKPIPVHPVTFKQHAVLTISLPSINVTNMTGSFSVMFKTTHRNVLLFYNEGSESNYFAGELADGVLRLWISNGRASNNTVFRTTMTLSDDRWHQLLVRQLNSGSFSFGVDGVPNTTLTLPPGFNKLDLIGPLYVGSLPEAKRSAEQPGGHLVYKKYSGCMGTVTVNEVLFNLMRRVPEESTLIAGCHRMSGFCSADTCQQGGICTEQFNGFVCDCNMTAYVGTTCNEEPDGYNFGSDNSRGLLFVNTTMRSDRTDDKIAVGFMTWSANGLLIRISSGPSSDCVNIKVDNGLVTIVYERGQLITGVLNESNITVNDGKYHVVSMSRHGTNVTLQVDGFEVRHTTVPDYVSGLLNYMANVTIGGLLNMTDNSVRNGFKGIIAGVYINGQRYIDQAVHGHNDNVQTRGDVVIAQHPFMLPKPTVPTVETFTADEDDVEPDEENDEIMPDSSFGVQSKQDRGVNNGVSDTAMGIHLTNRTQQLEAAGSHSDSSEGIGLFIEGGHVFRAELEMDLIDEPAIQWTGLPVDTSPMRSMVATGCILSLLAAAMSVVWAVYKFKPGLIGGVGINTSKVVDASFDGAAADAGTAEPKPLTRVGNGSIPNIHQHRTGRLALIRNAGCQTLLSDCSPSAAWEDGFETFQSYAGSGVAGLIATESWVTRGTQTVLVSVGLGQRVTSMSPADTETTGHSNDALSSVEEEQGSEQGSYSSISNLDNAGTVSSPPPQYGLCIDHRQSSSTADETLSSNSLTANRVVYRTNTAAAAAAAATVSVLRQPTSPNSPYSLSPPAPAGPTTSSFMASYLTPEGDKQQLQPQQRRLSTADNHSLNRESKRNSQLNRLSIAGEPTGFDESTIDGAAVAHGTSLQTTADGQYVVIGSNTGPPQVYSSKTGQLVQTMAGDAESSTDLHLAFNDMLLIGHVSLSDCQPDKRSSLRRRETLQIWDFRSGKALDMVPVSSRERQQTADWYTASTMFPDGQRAGLGKAELVPGHGSNGSRLRVTVVIYDLIANEPIRRLHYEDDRGYSMAADGDVETDQIGFMSVSSDSHYLVAAFQRSADKLTVFVVFDLISTSTVSTSMTNTIVLDSPPRSSMIVDASLMVTGTRSGSLVVWNLAHCTVIGELIANAVGQRQGHTAAVTSLDISYDHQCLLSASEDTTLKLWQLSTASLLHTLVGHTRTVVCCSFSSNKKLAVSGSMDRTVRLWRVLDGLPLAICQLGSEVLKVAITNDVRTVIAIVGHRLVMLQLTRAKPDQLHAPVIPGAQ